MNVTLKKQKPPVYAARRIIVKQIDKLGIEELKKRTLLNLEDLLKMLKWNDENGIRVFRLSSEMFQHKNNPKVKDYTYDFAIQHLKQVGDYAKSLGHRLTFHPGQFNNLGSPSTKVVEQTFKDLIYHAEVLDLLGYQYDTPLGKDSVMVIHGGGVYGNKKEAIRRWIENYYKLPQIVRNRLVLENCEKCYSILDCLEISVKVSRKSGEFLPVVLDTHHFECYKKLHPDEKFHDPREYMPLVLESWTDKGIKPKFHVSEQGSGKIGHHSDYIDILPEYLLEIPEKYGIKIDIMIEAKAKELSIHKLYEKYPQCNCLKDKITISKMDEGGTKKDGRRTAKRDEDIRVEWICGNINNNTELGKTIKEEYKSMFGLEILNVEKKGGNNIHYDILIHHTDGSVKKCEEKGTQKYSEIINENTPPHENSVEFYNGPAKKFSISKKYLKLWYDSVVNNPEINKKYDFPDPPSFEEWLIGGPYCMVDPKSEYSIKTKENYRGKYPKKSMNGCGHDEIDYRIEPNNAFDMTDEDKYTLIEMIVNSLKIHPKA
jgi:UV DNA damage endonuclease